MIPWALVRAADMLAGLVARVKNWRRNEMVGEFGRKMFWRLLYLSPG
jgi:hypothetical protein